MPMTDQPSAISHQPSGRRSEGICSPKKWVSLFVRFLALASCLWLLSCSGKPDANTLVMIIESSPTNLDPRVGLDGQSERIDGLLFDNLLSRDEHLTVKPGLAYSWDIHDPRTYIFDLHHDVKLSDGRQLTSRDV